MNEMFVSMIHMANTVIDNTGSQAAVGAAGDAAGGGAFSSFGILIPSIAIFLFMIFFTNRSQKKQEKQAREMIDSIGVNDEIVTSSGLYGKVAAVWHDSFLVEFGTNKGVTVPIRKENVVARQKPQINEPVYEDAEKKK